MLFNEPWLSLARRPHDGLGSVYHLRVAGDSPSPQCGLTGDGQLVGDCDGSMADLGVTRVVTV